MRHAPRLLGSAVAIAALSIAACGDDKMERGLVTEEEVQTPTSDKEMDETEKERDKEFVDELQESEE